VSKTVLLNRISWTWTFGLDRYLNCSRILACEFILATNIDEYIWRPLLPLVTVETTSLAQTPLVFDLLWIYCGSVIHHVVQQIHNEAIVKEVYYLVDSRLHPRCHILTNSTEHCIVIKLGTACHPYQSTGLLPIGPIV